MGISLTDYISGVIGEVANEDIIREAKKLTGGDK
jgi:hypothetical protein